MSEQTTEIAYIPLASGLDLSSGDTQKMLEETLGTIKSQPGCKSLFWGRQIEHPDVMQMVIDWESIESHKDFMNSPSYGPFIERLKPLLAGPPHLLHVKLPSQSPFSHPGAAPITECISMYFEPSYSTASYDPNWAKFKEGVEQMAKEAQGLTGGWGVEDVKHTVFGKEGEEGEGKLFWAVIGWPSVDAHMKFRETEEFKKVIPYLREGPKALEVHHVAFQKF
ncbi:uncharacterized protein BDR25DRAFT_287334 [Lindgomyces ingoldianus]|uniref:Uncharacterized protein n=1 Tax=Lindgomyces ingoldianus TaxID=673940 RepID=A0ACB6QTT7_9PLEO|nr:uncharacterized protein BDR25DRAFT_287334 [Lindgomyces ingoldianus]KAF2470414.1 hypothetical protein BDR25DRAFT_287334 [Lindgomyces ingoldianus]